MSELRGFCIVYSDGPSCQTFDDLVPVLLLAGFLLLALLLFVPPLLSRVRGRG